MALAKKPFNTHSFDYVRKLRKVNYDNETITSVTELYVDNNTIYNK